LWKEFSEIAWQEIDLAYEVIQATLRTM